jgi:hypothetical protein
MDDGFPLEVRQSEITVINALDYIPNLDKDSTHVMAQQNQTLC